MSGFGLVDIQGDLVGDGDAVAFEGDDFFGMVGEDANIAKAEINQNLGADTGFVLNHALTSGFAIELAAGMNMNGRKLSGFFGLIDAKAAAGVMQVEKDTTIFFGDGFERAFDEIFAVARS